MAEIATSSGKADFKEDPLVEIPKLTGTELLKKSQISGLDIRSMVVRCTICRSQINHLDFHKVKRHRRLLVIICKDCFDFYGTDEFSRDEAGNYNYCTWCGNGGTLFLCDFCPNVFCLNCVRRNFGRAEIAEMQKDGWKCYVCEPSKIKAKVAYCDLILDYSKARALKEKKDSEPMENKELISETWVLDAFNKTENACKSLQKKMNKLKTVEVSRSKSLKHIITKMEEVVSKHKTELGNIMKNLSNQYISYVKLKQAEERLQGSDTNSTNGNLSKADNLHKCTPMVSIKSNPKEGLELDKEKINSKMVPNSIDIFKQDSSAKDDEVSNTNSLKLNNSEHMHIEDNDQIDIKLKNSHQNSFDADLKEPDIIECNKRNTNNKTNSDFNVEIDIEAKAKMDLLNDSSEENEFESNNSFSENNTGEVKCKESKCCSDAVNITVTAEVHSSEFQKMSTSKKSIENDCQEFKTVSNKPQNVKKNCAIKESSISSLSSETCPSDSDSSTTKKMGKQRKKSLPKKLNKKPVIDYVNDLKLRTPVVVVCERCDDMLGGETTIKVPDKYVLEEVDQVIKKLMKDPSRKKKGEQTAFTRKKVKKPKAISKKSHKDTSSSISFSSSEEEEEENKKVNLVKSKPIVEDVEAQAKQELLESGDSSFSIDLSASGEEEKSKKKKSSSKVRSDSDDFQPKKKNKTDKLLTARLISDESSNEARKNSTQKKKKRKRLGSDEDFDLGSKDNAKSSDTTTLSDSDHSNKAKSKKRKRIKKAALSSSEKSECNEKDKEETETPKKGRKDLRKIISKKDLTQETKEAQQNERERRRRIEEKQKLYNMITDTSYDGDGKQVVTKKLVLEIDPISKEEIVQIHPDIIEKLKLHQVQGVKFMWECTIESLKELQKSPGSGCILAHCMGLGKTLQVITFLHTCLTNKEVNKKIKSAMVICPYNTVLNWSKEFDIWLAELDDAPITVHEMNNAKDNYARLDILKYWFKEGGVLIISYDIFRRLAGTKIPKLKKSLKEKLQEYLLDPGPDIVVCDEGHILKNETSAISKACSLLRTQRRIVLTGTPLQNNLKEYHCMLSFVKPHLLGTMKEFRNRFVNPIINGQYEDSNEYDVRRMKKRIHILHKLLEGCVQRCDYGALTKFLPPKHEYVLSVKLSEVQIKMYQWYLDNMSKAKGQQKIQGGTLFQDYNALRNICTHPYIIHTSFQRAEKKKIFKDVENDDYEDSFIDDSEASEKSDSKSDTDEVIKKYKTRGRKNSAEDATSAEEIEEKKEEWYHQFISDNDAHKISLSGKMVLLMNILKECEAIGDKVIIFSQSLLTLDIVEEVMFHGSDKENSEDNLTGSSYVEGLDYFRMDGSTSADTRKEFIDMFNSPFNSRARVFLVSTRAGGLGTNLVGANRVIILDASWNPSHDVQAIFRVYRFGQKKPVYIYRLLAQGTMEEKIYDRQVNKLSLSIRVVDEQQIDRHFNSTELSELYTFEPESQSNRPTPMVPSDRLLAEMLIKYDDLIVTYHEHDSLLQNKNEEDLTEEERKSAWTEYENEREGRSADYVAIDEEIARFCKEPDFNEADYDSPIIPDAKSLIQSLINSLKAKHPQGDNLLLRRKLLNAIGQLKAAFQEKQVQVLRLKQEFFNKGSVPSTVNKFSVELATVITEMNTHYARVYKLVNEDILAEQMRFQSAQAQAQANLNQNDFRARFQVPQATYSINPSTRLPNMSSAQFNNLPPHVKLNFIRAQMAYNNRATLNPSHGYTPFQRVQNQFKMFSPATSQPVVTEDPPEEHVKSTPAEENTKSTVVIEEIE